MTKTRGWYWKVHGDEYTKSSMGDIEEFVGWPTLMRLIEECQNTKYRPSPMWMKYLNTEDVKEYREHLIRRDQALIAALFLTGGRVNEVVPLRKVNFETHPRSIHVKGMAVLKRYKKLETIKDSQGNKHYITEPVTMTRGTFAIQPNEPLVPILNSWLAETEDYLFPSPAKTRSHISDVRAYQVVTSIGERMGVKIWNHWFRAQRASQLAVEYGFDIHKLADWFKWTKLDTARIYTKLNPSVYEDLYEEAEGKQSLREVVEAQKREIEALKTRLGEVQVGNPNTI